MVPFGGIMSDILPSLPTTNDPLDEAGGRALVEAWRASGLSGAAFCRLRNLRPQRLHYWRERLGYPIRVVGEACQPSVAAAPVTDGFVQVVVGDDVPSPTTYVDIVVGGASIRLQPGFDGALLRAVVDALRVGAARC
jgi:hypothetical protein